MSSMNPSTTSSTTSNAPASGPGARGGTGGFEVPTTEDPEPAYRFDDMPQPSYSGPFDVPPEPTDPVVGAPNEIPQYTPNYQPPAILGVLSGRGSDAWVVDTAAVDDVVTRTLASAEGVGTGWTEQHHDAQVAGVNRAVVMPYGGRYDLLFDGRSVGALDTFISEQTAEMARVATRITAACLTAKAAATAYARGDTEMAAQAQAVMKDVIVTNDFSLLDPYVPPAPQGGDAP